MSRLHVEVVGGFVFIAGIAHDDIAALEVATAIVLERLHVDDAHAHAHVVPLHGGGVEVEGVLCDSIAAQDIVAAARVARLQDETQVGAEVARA